MNNEIASRENIERELIIKYTFKGIHYCFEHPVILIGVCLAGTMIGTCIIIDKKGAM